METLRNLPDISGRRFGNIAIGYDRIDQIRTEVGTLETLAALVCGCSREDLTLAKVLALLTEVETRIARLTADERAQFDMVESHHLLAVALARLRP